MFDVRPPFLLIIRRRDPTAPSPQIITVERVRFPEGVRELLVEALKVSVVSGESISSTARFEVRKRRSFQ